LALQLPWRAAKQVLAMKAEMVAHRMQHSTDFQLRTSVFCATLAINSERSGGDRWSIGHMVATYFNEI